MVVLVDIVPTYLSLARVEDEDSFDSPTVDSVFDDGRVDARLSAEGDSRFDIVVDLIALDVGLRLLLDKDPLLEILEDLVLDDDRLGVVVDLDPGHLVVGDFVLVEESGVAVFALDPDAVLHVLLDGIVVDLAITADVLAPEGGVGPDIDSMFVILLDDIMLDQGLGGDEFYTHCVVGEGAADHLGLVRDSNFDAWTFVILDYGFLELGLGVVADQGDADLLVVDEGAVDHPEGLLFAGEDMDPTQGVVMDIAMLHDDVTVGGQDSAVVVLSVPHDLDVVHDGLCAWAEDDSWEDDRLLLRDI